MTLALLLLACTDAEPVVVPRRVEGIAAPALKVEPPEDFCDRWVEPGAGKPFIWPPLKEAAPADAGRWRWIDVWATWCAPCIVAMPMVEKWRARLAAEGVDHDFQLLSVDAEVLDLKKFYLGHPDFGPTAHLASGEALAPWFLANDIPEGTAIPLALFVDSSGLLRCTRAGQLSASDYATVKAILSL